MHEFIRTVNMPHFVLSSNCVLVINSMKTSHQTVDTLAVMVVHAFVTQSTYVVNQMQVGMCIYFYIVP